MIFQWHFFLFALPSFLLPPDTRIQLGGSFIFLEILFISGAVNTAMPNHKFSRDDDSCREAITIKQGEINTRFLFVLFIPITEILYDVAGLPIHPLSQMSCVKPLRII